MFLPDLTEVQQQLFDMNQRYDQIGERLADRHHELEGMLQHVKVYLTDLHDIMAWLDDKEHMTLPAKSLPIHEDEARSKMKEYQVLKNK